MAHRQRTLNISISSLHYCRVKSKRDRVVEVLKNLQSTNSHMTDDLQMLVDDRPTNDDPEYVWHLYIANVRQVIETKQK